MELAGEKCVPISGSTQPLTRDEVALLASDASGWTIGELAIERVITFKNFRAAMDFVNHIAEIAEMQNHHPDIAINYNKVTLALSTHKIGGLSRNDFILAAMINKVVG